MISILAMRNSIVLLALCLSIGCSKERADEPTESDPVAGVEASAPEPESAPTPEAGAEEPAEAAALPALGAPPSMKLLDPGEPPLEKRRLQLEQGSKRRFQVTADLMTGALLGGRLKVETILPPVVFDIQTEVTELGEDGAAKAQFTITNTKLGKNEDSDPKQLEPTKEAAAMMKGLTGSFSIDPHGVVHDEKLALPDEATAQAYGLLEEIRRALYQMSLPLPEEPIGQGAKWSVEQVVERDGARLNQISTFELTKAKGTLLSVNMKVEQTAPEQSYAPPAGRTQNLRLQLTRVDSTGTLEGQWDTKKLGPKSAKEVKDTAMHTVNHNLPKPFATTYASNARLTTRAR